jgi:NAD(P)H dehydrogenase (quinone)
MTRVLVLYYSSYGHVEAMANAQAEGARLRGADQAPAMEERTWPRGAGQSR